MFNENKWRAYVVYPHRHKGQVVMRKFYLLTDNQLEREINHTEELIERNTNKYRINDLTRYLRRLQKERYKRTKEQK